ncbi:hypothetical protein NQZ68_021063 [Dissostichus eleginoides]|nr:hypothetical protein NQZ68_021063 [Dissostichus eleginoides]
MADVPSEISYTWRDLPPLLLYSPYPSHFMCSQRLTLPTPSQEVPISVPPVAFVLLGSKPQCEGVEGTCGTKQGSRSLKVCLMLS